MPPNLDLPPRTWPDGAIPDDELFLDWLLACPREYQLRMLSAMRENAIQSAACFQRNYAGLQDEVTVLRRELSMTQADALSAWKRGYDQCRDDAEKAIMAAIDRDRNKTADGMDARHAGPHS